MNLWGNILIFALLFSAPAGWGTASTSTGHWSGSQEKETNPSTFEQLQEKVRLLEGSTDPNVWSDILALTGELESQNNSEEEKKLIEETRKKVNMLIALENLKTQDKYSIQDNKPNFTEAQELLKMREGLDPILSEGERKQFDKILTEKINSLGFKYDPKNGLQTRAQSFGQGPNIFVPPTIKSDSLGSVLGPTIPTPSYNFSDRNSSSSKPENNIAGNNNSGTLDAILGQQFPDRTKYLQTPDQSAAGTHGGDTVPDHSPDVDATPNPELTSASPIPSAAPSTPPASSTPEPPSTPAASTPTPSTPAASTPLASSNPAASASTPSTPSTPSESSTPSVSSAGGSSTHSGSASSGSSTSGSNTGSSSSSPAAPQVAAGSLAPTLLTAPSIPTTSPLDPARDPASLGNSTPASTSSANSSPITSPTRSDSTDKSPNAKLSPGNSPQGSSTPTNPTIDATGLTNDLTKIQAEGIQNGEKPISGDNPIAPGDPITLGEVSDGQPLKTKDLKVPQTSTAVVPIQADGIPDGGKPISGDKPITAENINPGATLKDGKPIEADGIEKEMLSLTKEQIMARGYATPLSNSAYDSLSQLNTLSKLKFAGLVSEILEPPSNERIWEPQQPSDPHPKDPKAAALLPVFGPVTRPKAVPQLPSIAGVRKKKSDLWEFVEGDAPPKISRAIAGQ